MAVGGRTVADAATWVPPHARRVALLAQEPLLFPHLDALGNVAFGPRAAGTPRGEAARRAHELLEQVGVGGLARRRPAELSGGQAQRVALARALAPDPTSCCWTSRSPPSTSGPPPRCGRSCATCCARPGARRSACERCSTGSPRSRAAASSGLDSRTAVETTSEPVSGTCAAS
ncbi:ATP-binding cassette domain-containing protein [Georgenia sp. SUBG003]|uniref:ATP-binding cassette domain-containing protein n=1 Tax=Georgenia sp. SUBG003 TaxID=1497974 RepID=UPI003AB28AB1